MHDEEKVLFVSVRNSARSQMAEEPLRQMAGDRYEGESAGLEPGTIHPAVVEVLKEDGVDLSGKRTRSVFDLFKAGRLYQYVITACDGAQSEKCPVFPSAIERLHWDFEDPAGFTGTPEKVLGRVRILRDRIRIRLIQWLREHEAGF